MTVNKRESSNPAVLRRDSKKTGIPFFTNEGNKGRNVVFTVGKVGNLSLTSRARKIYEDMFVINLDGFLVLLPEYNFDKQAHFSIIKALTYLLVQFDSAKVIKSFKKRPVHICS